MRKSDNFIYQYIKVVCSFFNYFILLLFLLFNVVSKGQAPTCIGEQGNLEWMLFENSLGSVDQNPFYPQSPDQIEIIHSLETVENYNDYYASIIKGFLVVPDSGKYLFNVTGRDNVNFFLSTNENEENISLLISTTGTGYSQYDQNINQTDSVDLVPDKYYYFEIRHTESTGSDQIRISWKTPLYSAQWKTIGREYLFGYACNNTCATKGTPCDDGNKETVNDLFDGACNCMGTPKKLPDCVGEQGVVQALYYDNIQGTTLLELLNAPAYPLQPSRAENLTAMRMPNRSTHDYFGSSVKACLRIPVSGEYMFSAVGNTIVEVYFGTSPDLANMTLLAGSSGKTSSLQLSSDQFYFLKLIHKENLNNEEFALLWKTPFQFDDNWKYVDGAYLFQYNCELACIPEGTTCNDGNPETINDAYDANCNCTGIYCPNGNCAESTTFPHYEACETTGRHSAYPDDSWLSCEPSQSVNTKRENSQWIQYDLGSVMPIGGSHIWNYNVAGNTGKGFKSTAIDLSTDGTTWKEFGIFEWPEASGTNDYLGFVGPDFTNYSARYVLITRLSNWDGSDCSGFSEIKFKVALCPQEGTPCNDNDLTTENDRYNSNCLCKGDFINTIDIQKIESYLKIYPNPSNDWTNLVFYLKEPTIIDINVHDISGRLIFQLANKQLYLAGNHQKSLPAHRLKQGQYIVTLKTETRVITEKFIVIE